MCGAHRALGRLHNRAQNSRASSLPAWRPEALLAAMISRSKHLAQTIARCALTRGLSTLEAASASAATRGAPLWPQASLAARNRLCLNPGEHFRQPYGERPSHRLSSGLQLCRSRHHAGPAFPCADYFEGLKSMISGAELARHQESTSIGQPFAAAALCMHQVPPPRWPQAPHEEGGAIRQLQQLWADSVRRKRKHKMNKHKHKKRRKLLRMRK